MADTSAADQPWIMPDDAVPLLELKFDQASLGTLRAELGRCAEVNGLAETDLSNFILAVNEIATNAIRYAGGHGRLSLWRCGPQLCCLVVDDGPGIPRRHLDQARRPTPGHIGGHGLWLARHICTSIQIDSDRRSGTRVLLQYALPAVGP